ERHRCAKVSIKRFPSLAQKACFYCTLEKSSSGPQMVWTGHCAARPFSAVYRSLLDRNNALAHLTPGTMAPASTADRHRLCVSPVEEIRRSPLESGVYLHHWNGLSVARLPPACAALSLPFNAAMCR